MSNQGTSNACLWRVDGTTSVGRVTHIVSGSTAYAARRAWAAAVRAEGATPLRQKHARTSLIEEDEQ